MNENGSEKENKKRGSVDGKGKVYSKVLRQEARERFPDGNGRSGACEQALGEPRDEHWSWQVSRGHSLLLTEGPSVSLARAKENAALFFFFFSRCELSIPWGNGSFYLFIGNRNFLGVQTFCTQVMWTSCLKIFVLKMSLEMSSFIHV